MNSAWAAFAPFPGSLCDTLIGRTTTWAMRLRALTGLVALIDRHNDPALSRRLQAMASISALPRADQRFMMAMRVWISAV